MARVSLIVPNTRYDGQSLWSVLPSRGLLMLAAMLRREGHPVQYVDADIDDLSHTAILHRLKQFRAEVVGITMNTFQATAGLALAGAIKQATAETLVVVGGPHPSALGAELLEADQNIDVVCIGESEETIVEVVSTAERCLRLGAIAGIVWRDRGQVMVTAQRPPLQDLDRLPYPAYELAGDLSRYPGAQPTLRSPSMHLLASRGCPYGCVFCTKSVWGRHVRFRSASNVADEVEFLHREKGINEVFFQDDTMNVDRRWFYRICDEIVDRKLNNTMSFKAPFRVNASLLDEELLEKARAAGFWMAFFGVESGSQRVLDAIKKGITIEEVERAFRLTHQAGIKTIAAFMVGNIGDTAETVRESIDLAKRIRPSVFGFSVATPLPGTEFHDVARKRGWISVSDYAKYSQFLAVSRNEALTEAEITQLRDEADHEVREYLAPHGALVQPRH